MSAADPPNPGSREALDAGCRCPVLDNGHGRGYMGGVTDEQGRTVFVYAEGCPLHFPNGFEEGPPLWQTS